MTVEMIGITDDGADLITITDTANFAEIASSTVDFGWLPGHIGPTGVEGPQGPVGPQGPPGPSGGNFRYVQESPSALWDIAHNLDFFPNITVIDSGGSVVEGEIEHIDRNNVRLRYSEAFGGTAYLS